MYVESQFSPNCVGVFVCVRVCSVFGLLIFKIITTVQKLLREYMSAVGVVSKNAPFV